MALAFSVILVTLAACFAQVQNFEQFVTEVTKGNSEHVDNLVELGKYAIKHGDCFAELDEREVYCQDQYALGAAKIRVEESGGEAEIIIPELAIGTIYGGKAMQKRWRIAIARRSDICRAPMPLPSAKVTLYVACYPLNADSAKVLQKLDNDSIVV